jgi:hypothetical protein
MHTLRPGVQSRRRTLSCLAAGGAIALAAACGSSAASPASAGNDTVVPSSPQPLPSVEPNQVPKKNDPRAHHLSSQGGYLDIASSDSIDQPTGASCELLHDPGWTVNQCGLSADNIAYVVEKRPAGTVTAWRAHVLVRLKDAGWSTVLGYADDSGERVSSIGLQVTDLNKDGKPEGIFGYHLKGGRNELAYDVADRDYVWGHRDGLARGVVRVDPSGIIEVSARYASTDDDHPSYWQRTQVTGLYGTLDALDTSRYPADAEPLTGNI